MKILDELIMPIVTPVIVYLGLGETSAFIFYVLIKLIVGCGLFFLALYIPALVLIYIRDGFIALYKNIFGSSPSFRWLKAGWIKYVVFAVIFFILFKYLVLLPAMGGRTSGF